MTLMLKLKFKDIEHTQEKHEKYMYTLHQEVDSVLKRFFSSMVIDDHDERLLIFYNFMLNYLMKVAHTHSNNSEEFKDALKNIKKVYEKTFDTFIEMAEEIYSEENK